MDGKFSQNSESNSCNNTNSTQLKRKKGPEFDCILQCGNPCSAADSLNNITHDKWQSLQNKAANWKGLSKFGNVIFKVDWEMGPKGHHMHSSCYTTISNNRKLLQFEKRKSKSEQILKENTLSSECRNDSNLNVRSSKKLRSITGILHNKNCCVWSMKGKDNSNDFNLDASSPK